MSQPTPTHDATASSQRSADGLDHATSEIASSSKPGIDATKKIPDEGFKHPCPPLTKMNETVREKINSLFGKVR